MNNYDEEHIEQNIEDYINGNNYDSINRLLFIALYLYFQQMTSNVVLINVILTFTCLSIIMSISAIGALALID